MVARLAMTHRNRRFSLLATVIAGSLLGQAWPARAALPSRPWPWKLAPDEAPPAAAGESAGETGGFGRPATAEESASLTPPRLLGDPHIEYPRDAPRLADPVDVEATLVVDADGSVRDVRITHSGGPAFDAAVVAGLAAFRFEPARYRGEPVAVRIDYTQEFRPPPGTETPEPARATRAAVASAVIEGTLVTKGTRERIVAGVVMARADGHEVTATSDEHGRFRLPVPPGHVDVEVRAVGYKRFHVRERLAERERILVRYLVERTTYDAYETVVVSKRDRQEVARTTLRGRELTDVPGTFGDPFRVITTLPGVTQAVSVLAYPIVRGTSPGNSGFLLDGTPVPQLFHLFAGPAVIHPELIDRIDFYPGVFPARYGGYTGGIVDGNTRRPGKDERRIDMTLDLTKVGLLVREPAGGLGTLTVAGRYGYPAVVLGLLQSTAYFNYWDYQLRFDTGRSPAFTAFAFGSFDEAGEMSDGEKLSSLRTMFHRLELRVARPTPSGHDLAAVVLGLDQMMSTSLTSQGFVGDVTSFSVFPRLESERALGDGLLLRVGADGRLRRLRGLSEIDAGGMSLSLQGETYEAGVYVELPWEVTPRLSLLPGVRGDLFVAGNVTLGDVDPRLALRYRLADLGDGPVTLKAGVGRYHQPPRFYIPVPGFDEIALDRGLLASIQSSVGVEAPLGSALDLDAQAYYHHMDPIILDLAPNPTSPDASWNPLPPGWQPGQGSPLDPKILTDQLLTTRTGRSYGIELIVRKNDLGRTFGWLSYTLSRTERRFEGRWVPYDFDRRHVLQLVTGVRLPRDWDFSTHLQVQSGRPVTTAAGYNRGLTAPFFRVDLRVDKRAVWQSWMLDFFVDVANVTLASERVDDNPDASFRYVLPTAGVRAIF